MTILNVGMAEVAGLIGTDTTSGRIAFDYIGIGTGTTASGATDTWLETEQQVATSTGTRIQTTVANDTLQLVKDAFTFSGNHAITESIVANAASAAEALCRQVFSAVNVTASDELKVTWKVQIKQGS